MAVSVASFLVEFPEFVGSNTAKPAYVAATLARAQEHCSLAHWGARYDRGVYLKAAHFLAMSPMGENARLNKFSEKTVYSVLFDEELLALPVRMMTT